MQQDHRHQRIHCRPINAEPLLAQRKGRRPVPRLESRLGKGRDGAEAAVIIGEGAVDQGCDGFDPFRVTAGCLKLFLGRRRDVRRSQCCLATPDRLHRHAPSC